MSNLPCALVTGSTDGIGEHTALQLSRMGFRVFLHGRSPERCKAAAERIRSAHPTAVLEVGIYFVGPGFMKGGANERACIRKNAGARMGQWKQCCMDTLKVPP